MRYVALLLLSACYTSPKPQPPDAGTAGVTVTITGSGTIKADGIDCSATNSTTAGTCGLEHGASTTTFRATPAAAFRFERWEVSRGGGPFLPFGTLPTLTIDLSLPVPAAVRGVFVSLDASVPVPLVIEGTLSVINTNGTGGSTTAAATFGVYTDATVTRRTVTRGEVSVYTFNGVAEIDFLSAGIITLNFLSGQHQLIPDTTKFYDPISASPEIGTVGESLGIAWPGDDIGAFNGTLIVPSSPLVISQPQLGGGTAIIDRAKPTQLVWDNTGTGDLIIIIEQNETAKTVRADLRYPRTLGTATILPSDVSDFAAGPANIYVEGGDVKITNLPVKGGGQAHVRVGTSCEIHNFQGTPLTFPEAVTLK